jgi:hypothetical protein
MHNAFLDESEQICKCHIGYEVQSVPDIFTGDYSSSVQDIVHTCVYPGN